MNLHKKYLLLLCHFHLLSFLSFQLLGCGCVAQATLSRGHFGGIVTINVGFAMAVSMAIYVTGGVSGMYVIEIIIVTIISTILMC